MGLERLQGPCHTVPWVLEQDEGGHEAELESLPCSGWGRTEAG